jgi:hypothetical protein
MVDTIQNGDEAFLDHYGSELYADRPQCVVIRDVVPKNLRRGFQQKKAPPPPPRGLEYLEMLPAFPGKLIPPSGLSFPIKIGPGLK